MGCEGDPRFAANGLEATPSRGDLPNPSQLLNLVDSSVVNDSHDAQLMSRLVADPADVAALVALQTRWRRPLLVLIKAYVGNFADAQDIDQNVWIAVHARPGLFKPAEGAFFPWLLAVARNKSIDHLRLVGRRPAISLDGLGSGGDGSSLADTLAGDEAPPLALLLDAEDRQWVREAMGQLSEAVRPAVEMSYFDGLLYREIAERLGIGMSATKGRIYLGLMKMKELAEQSGRWR